MKTKAGLFGISLDTEVPDMHSVRLLKPDYGQAKWPDQILSIPE